MLKLLGKNPDDLGKRGEIAKNSPALDRMTGDTADLRFYSSNDGKRTYLRVWETQASAPDAARWYEVLPAKEEPAEPTLKK